MTSSVRDEWYVWTVKQGKFDIVSKFISEDVPEVTRVLYPTITKERSTKTGIVKKSKVPLYSGYLFLQYKHNPEEPKVWLKLRSHPFITRYVGPCTPKDLASVESLEKIEDINTEDKKIFKPGDRVRVNGGFLKEMTGEVTSCLSGNTIQVSINFFGRDVKATFVPADLDIVGREE